MNLRRIDLNLLVAFDTLMTTRHVTRAAHLVGIGQPGMSAALARLREMFGDALLVKQSGEMVPTERALELEPEIRRILREVDRLVADRGGFDPSTSRRRFTVRMSDLLSFLLLPTLMQRLERTAAQIGLEVVHLAPDATADALERNTVELAVSTDLKVPKSVSSAPLFKDRVVVIARQPIDAETEFPARRQIKVAQSPADDRFAGRRLDAVNGQSRIALTLPHWLAMPEILRQTDLIALVPESIASRFAASHGIVSSESPVADTSFAWTLYWHRRHDNDQGLAWLRDQIAAAADQRAADGRAENAESKLGR